MGERNERKKSGAIYSRQRITERAGELT